MGSLSTCLKKAGEVLSPKDREAIFKLATEYRAQGLTPADAARKAVQEHGSTVKTSLGEVEAAMREGRALYDTADGPAPMFDEGLQMPTGRFDQDGNEVTMSANEYVARAQAEAETTKATAKQFMDAAASCLMGVL